MIKRLLVMTLPLAAGAIITAASAGANPFCVPANGPAGMLWPQVQMCHPYLPGAGYIPRYFATPPPQNVPYPIANIATPGWPFQTNPELPGGPYSPGG